MLITLWLRLGAFLGKLLLWLLVLGVLGWALATAWLAWQQRGPVSAQESIADDEAAMTRDIIQTAVRIVDQHRESTRFLRDAHAKAHGCVKAEVQVLPELASELRQGVFSEPGKTWQATMRLSNGNAYPQFDSIRDARGMAIKLLDVPGKQLLSDQPGRSEQDFVMFSHPNFFVSNVAEYRQNVAAQAEGKKMMAFFPGWDPRSWQVRHLLLPWRHCPLLHQAQPGRRTFRFHPTNSVRPMRSSGSCPIRTVALPTTCRNKTASCRTSCAMR